ncbi:MAG: hypothetical protein ACTSR8_02335 [Promethearchaeota archaeon]
MSLHGNQNILPLFIPKDQKLAPLSENEELTIAFLLLTNEINPSEKIISFSRLLWPLLSIQGVISTHIILDGLLILNKKDKLTNPPRQPLIGHLLRNIDNRSKIEQLERIIDVLTYKDSEAEKIGEGEESEFQTLIIDGLLKPELLEVIMKLIPLLENKPIADYMQLDASLTTEQALNISEQYRQVIETMNGNALRWDTITELVGKTVDKWLTDLSVKIKDIESRYSSQINKTSSTIDPSQIKSRLEKERDRIDQWKVTEKKKVIESISALFKTPERHMEEMLKKNRFFSRDEILKSKNLEDIFPSFEKHFEFLKTEAKKFIELIDILTTRYEELKAESSHIDIEAEEKIEKLELELNAKLQDRNKEIVQVSEEKEKTLSELEELRNNIEELYNRASQIIQTKKANCLNEKNQLIQWSIKDSDSEFFSKPIQWVHLPLYAMFVEDEDMMEERMIAIFPGYIDKEDVYTELSEDIIELRNFIHEKVEDDMKVRSNFEFSCENKNLIEDPNFSKKIQKGISVLKNRELISEDTEQKVRNSLKKLQ